MTRDQQPHRDPDPRLQLFFVWFFFLNIAGTRNFYLRGRNRRAHAGVRGFVGRGCCPLGRVKELRGHGGRGGELRRARRGGDSCGEQHRGRGARWLPRPLSVRGGWAAAPGGLLGPGAPGDTEQPERVHILPVSQHPGFQLYLFRQTCCS